MNVLATKVLIISFAHLTAKNSQRIEDVLQTAKIVAGSTISSVFPSAIVMKAGWI